MTALGESTLLQALGWAVINSLWQMALLWVVYQCIISLYKNIKPHQKSGLATLVLCSGFLWFVFTFVSILFSAKPESHSLVSSSLVTINGSTDLNEWLKTTLPIASIVYLVLLVIPAVSFVRNYRFVQILRRSGLSKTDVQWRMFVNRISSQMGIARKVNVWISEHITSPVTIGFLKPIILLPVAAISNLTPQQLEAVLLHELAHIRRFDYMMNLVVTFIRTILYFNPFVKLFISVIEREREKSCDEMVIQFQYDPHGYASALLLLERNNMVTRPMALAASGKKTDLVHRIERILGIEKRPIFSFNRLAGMFAGLLCIIALNAMLILSKPIANSNSFALQQLNPFFMFYEEDVPNSDLPSDEMIAKAEINNTIENKARDRERVETTKSDIEINDQTILEQPPFQFTSGYFANPQFSTQALTPQMVNANYRVTETPMLKKYQEMQVAEAIALSKKVLLEKEWKEIDKSIGDAMTSQEKQILRLQYQKELEEVNWNQLQTQVKMAYDKINWDKVGAELEKAMVEIRLDSLQQVYTYTLSQLNKVECLIEQGQQQNIIVVPDSDINLKNVRAKKVETIRELNRVKAVRAKKIVEL